jgi:uncharacterized protein YggE
MKRAYNIWIYKTAIVAVMVLSLTSSMAFVPQMEQRVMVPCASSDNQDTDISTLAISVYTANQSSTAALNFKFSNEFIHFFSGLEECKCVSLLLNQFDLFLSKHFLVLVQRIISPNAP